MRRLTTFSVFFAQASGIAQPSPQREMGRRQYLELVQKALLASGCAATSGLVFLQAQRMGEDATFAEWEDPLLQTLRSSTGASARKERALLEAEWQQLREEQRAGLIGRARAEEALETVLRVRAAIRQAAALSKDRRFDLVDGVITKALIRELEAAATVLASSSALSRDSREAIGWQWGACGFRRCGAQADAAQSLSKLRANLGMVVPLEALFYLDVAARAVDEMLLLAKAEGLLDDNALGASVGEDYLSRETLEMILPAEDVASGDANLPVIRGGDTEAEGALEEMEAALLKELEESPGWDAQDRSVAATAE